MGKAARKANREVVQTPRAERVYSEMTIEAVGWCDDHDISHADLHAAVGGVENFTVWTTWAHREALTAYLVSTGFPVGVPVLERQAGPISNRADRRRR